MKTLFVTDPLAWLAADIDASIGLMDACQSEGAEVWVCEPADLGVAEGRLLARARRISLRPRRRGTDHRWQVGSPWHDEIERADLDVAASCALVWLRIDPPVDARYLHTTYLLDLAAAAGVRVVNHPAGVRACTRSCSPCTSPTSPPRPS
jgi:glutathione synthase